MMVIHKDKIEQHLPTLVNHFSQLSKQDCYYRFFHTINIAAIERWLSHLPYTPYENILFISKVDDKIIGLGQLSVDTNNNGEIALSVVPNERNKKIGQTLLAFIIGYAKQITLNSLTYQCEPDNIICRKIFDNFGFNSKYSREHECVVGQLPLFN